MAYKKLSEATLVESVAEEATMLIEENDEIKRASVKDTMEKYGFSAGGGGGGEKILKFIVKDYEVIESNTSFEELKNFIETGKYIPCIVFTSNYDGHYSTNLCENVEKQNPDIVLQYDSSKRIIIAPDNTMTFSEPD